MDLSFLKWPLIVVIVVAVGWLFTEGGVNYMEKKFTSGAVGEDAEVDRVNEEGLSRLGGYLMKTFRYARADEILERCGERYPEGANYWRNYYRRAKLQEKLAEAATDPDTKTNHYRFALDILKDLMDNDAHSLDERVPEYNVLRLRAEKLAETHELGEVGDF